MGWFPYHLPFTIIRTDNVARQISHPISSKVLIIAGMHRSGTSLTANWLAHCGLHVGDELLKRETDNPTGHYEDLSFLHLHVDILRANGTDFLVADDRRLDVSPDQQARARALVESRADHSQWGWKDPRTALFLDLWRGLVPQAKVLVVYRHYAHVADSLLRREGARALRTLNTGVLHHRLAHTRKLAFLRRIPGLLGLVRRAEPPMRRLQTRWSYTALNWGRLRVYLRTWERYNRDILAFAEAHPDDTLVIHIDDLPHVSESLISFLNETWGFGLHYTPVGDVFVEGMLKTRRLPVLERLSAALAPECRRTYNALGTWRERSLTRLAIPHHNE